MAKANMTHAGLVVRSGVSRTGEGFVIFEWQHHNGKFQLTFEEAIALARQIAAETFAAHYDAELFTELTALLDANDIGPPEERRALVAKLTAELRNRRKESPLS